jgi:EAL domain-containing protein (putative c-di-GMP-specific phosphodiesterase class I)
VPYRNVSRLRTALAELRQSGIRIAVDDLGFGHGNLRMVLDVRPEYLKIERYFVDGCADDGDRRAMLRSVTSLARDFQSLVIAEGVERPDDLEVLRDLGIPLAQGYLLARPMSQSQSGEHAAALAFPLEDPLS